MPDENTSGAQGTAAIDSQAQAAQGAGGGGTGDGGGGGFNWEMFPNVPEEQRSLLEPHLKQVQGHVTQLEQKYAPYKGFLDSGTEAETIQSLLNLDQAFQQDPVGTWLMLGENMQKSGGLSGDLDLEAVKAILNGEEPSEVGGDEGGAAEGEEMPAWAKRLEQRLDAQEQQEQQRTQQSEAQQRQNQLNEAVETITNQLKEAGFTDDQLKVVEDQNLVVSAIIAQKGDADKALASLAGLRESLLKGLTNGNGSSKEEDDDNAEGATMPKGSPKAPKRDFRGAGKEFQDARRGAAQMLEQRLREQAQS